MKKHLKLVISSLIMLSMLLAYTPFATYATEVDETDETENVTEEVIDETTKETTEEVVPETTDEVVPEVTEEVIPETTEPNETVVEQKEYKIKDTFADSYLAQAIADMYTDGNIEGVITAEDIEKTTNLRIRVTAPVSTLSGVEIFKNIDTFMFGAVIPEGEFDGHGIVVEVPDSFATLTKLKNVEINFANLSKFPEVFLQMPKLERIRLDGTGIDGIPEGISGLVNLENFELANNVIPALPNALFQLPALRTLILSDAALMAIPDEIYSIPNLEALDISGNMFGTVSPSIANAKNLKSFYAERCGLSTLPIEITQLENLTDISVSSNSIFNLPIDVYKFVATRTTISGFKDQSTAIKHVEEPFTEGDPIAIDMYADKENRIHDIVPSIVTEYTVKKVPIVNGEADYDNSVHVGGDYRFEDGQLKIYSLPKLEEKEAYYVAYLEMHDTESYTNPWSGSMMCTFTVVQKEVTTVTPTKGTKKTTKSPITGDPTIVLPVATLGLAALGTILKLKKK